MGLKEGGRVKLAILAGGDFYNLVESLELEAKKDIDMVVDEVYGRARRGLA